MAAVGVTGPTQRLTKTRLLSLARYVSAAAKAISVRLGPPDGERFDVRRLSTRRRRVIS